MRLTEYKFSNEEDVVNKILKHVHAAIDREFPNAPPAPPKFSQTVFQAVEDTRIEAPQDIKEHTLEEPVELESRKWLHIAILFLCLTALAALWFYQQILQ